MMVAAGLMTVKQRDYILKLQNRMKSPNKKAESDPKTIPVQQPLENPQKQPQKKQPQKKQPQKKQAQEKQAQIKEASALLDPEIIAGCIKLQISRDFMAAFISKTDQFNPDIPTMEIKEALFEHDIVNGIVVDDMIEGFVKSSGFKTQLFRVARGVKPISGQDAKLGTEMAGPSRIKVGQDAFTEKELGKNKTKVRAMRETLEKLQGKKDTLKEQNAELQKQITKLAHVQDRSQLEQREIEAKMASPENATLLGELKEQFAQLKANAHNAESNLDRCFEKSEAIEEAIEKIDKEIVSWEGKIEEMTQEKKNLVQWAKENPGNALIACDGSIQPGTVICGKHSEMTVDNVLRRAKVREVLFTAGNENRQVYEMQIQNL